MGSTKNVSAVETEVNYKVVETPEADAPVEKTVTVKAPARIRSRKYQATRSQVDKTRFYDAFSAIELVKKLSYAKFPATISADLVLREVGDKFDVAFPHTTGKAVRVATVDEALLEKIEAGQIDFDVLLTTPQFMPKLAKFARILGPKGLMPNPKNGTITTDPAKKQAELEGGKVTLKTEKKAPLIHVSIGKVDVDTKDLLENLNALLKAGGERILKLSLSATMSPGVKVDLKTKAE